MTPNAGAPATFRQLQARVIELESKLGAADEAWHEQEDELQALRGKLGGETKRADVYERSHLELRDTLGVDPYAEHEHVIETIRRIRGREDSLDVRTQELESRLGKAIDELGKASVAWDDEKKARMSAESRLGDLSNAVSRFLSHGRHMGDRIVEEELTKLVLALRASVVERQTP